MEHKRNKNSIKKLQKYNIYVRISKKKKGTGKMKIKPGFMLRNVAGRDIVVAVGSASMDFNGMISLNETAAFLWKKLEQGADYDALLAAMLDEYETDEITAKEGIDAFLETARNAGLIDEE